MTPPSIKLRDGWTWERDHDGSWWARSDDFPPVCAGWDVVRRRLIADDEPADVALAVIEANAPEVLREFVAGLATPRDRTKPPPQWVVTEHEIEDDDGDVDVLFHPMPLVGTDGMKTVYHDRDECLAAMHAHTDAVAADCYPEMAARIAELEREVAALRRAAVEPPEDEEPSAAALAAVAEVERAAAAYLAAKPEPEKPPRWTERTWLRRPPTPRPSDDERNALVEQFIEAWRRTAAKPTTEAEVAALREEREVEWVDGRATAGGVELECVRVDAATWTVSIGERLRVMFEECDEYTAQAGAVAVARAMEVTRGL